MVIDAEKVEEGGVEVANVNDVFLGFVAEFVGRAVTEAGLYAASGHPHGEAFDMVIASGAAFALEHGGASEFASPDNEGVLEESALFEIGEEGVGRLVRVLAADFHVFIEVAMMVPASMIELHKAGAFFDQSTSEKAVRSIGAIAGSSAIHFEGLL